LYSLILCIDSRERVHGGGIEGVRIGLSLLAPSLPPLCPLYALCEEHLDHEYIETEFQGFAVKKEVPVHAVSFNTDYSNQISNY